MPRLLITLTALFTLLHSADVHAAFCAKWDEPKKVGELGRKILPEASGVAASILFPGRVYWINDSGSKPVVYFSQLDGKGAGKSELKIESLRDAEALAVASCGTESCLIVGDTGDNSRRRKNALLSLFKETDLKESGAAKPQRQLKVKYPDGPHDVEAMTALPNGDLLFISKEVTLSDAANAHVFVIAKEDWVDAQSGDTLVAKETGTLPVSRWLEGKTFLGAAVTDASVNSERSVLGVLTYSALVEIPLSKLQDIGNVAQWNQDTDYKIVPIRNLNQQETLTYLKNPDRALWSSEAGAKEPAPIYTLTCKEK